MKTNFRHEARRALDRAKEELARADDVRLRYAALELRMAIEALTYDRAKAFHKELPPAEYETWQPRNLLQVLLAIYPDADKGSTLSIGFSKMHSLGTEVVFDLQAVKRHYDALGSYLHMPNLKQVDENGISYDQLRLRARCEEVAELIENVLSSPHWNSNFGEFSTLACSRCGKPVRRRMTPGREVVDAECFGCGAKYTLTSKEGDTVEWMPVGHRVPCPTEGCEEQQFFWSDEAKPGMWFQCGRCKKGWKVALGSWSAAVTLIHDWTFRVGGSAGSVGSRAQQLQAIKTGQDHYPSRWAASARMAAVVGGRADIRIVDKDGRIITDTKRERIDDRNRMGALIAKHHNDVLLKGMMDSYAAAVADPDDELTHLYEIRDAAAKKFAGGKAAQDALGITSSSWSNFGEICNEYPLQQGRHRGKKREELRKATSEELESARRFARSLIEGYVCYLETQPTG